MLTLFSGRHLMHVRRLLALSLAVPLLLAGCSDEPKPTPKMPESTSSSPTTEPTEAETPEAESPEDFIRRWQAAALSAQNQGDTSEYRALGPRCKPCSDFADQVDRIYDEGGSVVLTSLDVISVAPAPGAEQFRLTRVLGKTKVLDSQGEQQQAFAGGREVLNVFLEQVRGKWRVQNFLRTKA
ncbi:DUF3558 domain-containing protein [Nocardioides cavernae]|uniref:hypothetical protein n=1 Tax=Nocardioides TaxID=1839 RepID=UPI0012E3C06F|nr:MULTISPECIES: hypothetical protein [Nocardioides]MCK9822352.1 DUF3558 domain-containing protein [Nocardioides cavernae]